MEHVRPPETPVAPPAAPEQPKTRRITPEDALAAAAAAAGIAHALIDVPPPEEPIESPAPVERPGWKRTEVGTRVNETVFHDETSTGGIQDGFVDLYARVFSSPEGTCYYFDARGTLLLTAQAPQEIARLKEAVKLQTETGKDASALLRELETKVQAWHNENRRRVSEHPVTPADYDAVGYPFVASPVLRGAETSPDSSLVDVVMGRLHERTKTTGSGPSYFGGEERSVYDAVVDIAKAYDLPRAIVLGVAANESAFNKLAERPDSGARGIFQFTKDGYEDAKAYAERHPEFGARVRTGAIGPYEESWKNRFVSTELFCAYYRVIRERTRDAVEALETRLAALDPSYQAGTLDDIVAINAYNAGPGRIRACIDRFLSLNDVEIRGRIGEPPYGVDAWLGVTSLSFGLSVNEESARMGPDAFQYPQKVLAMGSLIMEEENYLSARNRVRSPEEAAENAAPPRRGLWKALSTLTGVAALLGGSASAARTAVNVRARTEEPRLTRRDVIRGGIAATAAAAPILKAAGERLANIEIPNPPEPPAEATYETFADVLPDARASLDALHETLRARAREHKSGWTPDELDRIREYTAPRNRELLGARIERMLGRDLLKRFEASERLPFKQRVPLYEEASEKQEAYVRSEIANGNLVALEANDASNAYFCEQVGRDSGMGNDSDALFARKEFIPLLGTLIGLVNHQIDAFNADPSLYGVRDPKFPAIPRLSSIKISGALRFVEATKRMFETGQGGRTTPGVSVHWLGNALDLGSFATPGGNMARLDGDLRESKGGGVVFKRGDKLPNQGFGKRTREILSVMVGRALFAAQDALKTKHGLHIQPLWEARQLNWHVALDAKTE